MRPSIVTAHFALLLSRRRGLDQPKGGKTIAIEPIAKPPDEKIK
jgi:hypothetical protein